MYPIHSSALQKNKAEKGNAGADGGVILNNVVREDLTEKVTFKQILEEVKEQVLVYLWRPPRVE